MRMIVVLWRFNLAEDFACFRSYFATFCLEYNIKVKQGLYDPQFEHDSCGVGFVVNIKGRKSHQIIRRRSRS
jgi:hypothetical protein